ncbi:MAG TPA: branched-chain amino acid ABC transporter permease [Acidimicrobiia bacterium]|nr:branched-chain amino acid ABC transporter permease [Acidimicrobiia bacterium]
MVDAVVQGILLGGLYALLAAGLTLVFGVMKVVNLAHGDFIVMAGYLTLVLVGATDLNPLLVAPVVAVLMGAVGYGLQRGVINLSLGGGIVPPLIVTFGLSIIIQNALQEIFSADTQGLDAGPIELSSIRLGDVVTIGWFPLLTLLVAVLVLLGLHGMLSKTSLGRAFRAVSDDPEAARMMGVQTKHVFSIATAVAMVVVGIGGVMLGIRTQFDASLGPARLIFAFEAVIIGGMGSLWGTLAGGVVLGVAQNVGAHLSPGWSELGGHLVFLAVLAYRPQGLFGQVTS